MRSKSKSALITDKEVLTFVQDLYSLLTWPTLEQRSSQGEVKEKPLPTADLRFKDK